MWELLGRILVLHSVEPEPRVLIVTPDPPPVGSDGYKAIQAAGPGRVFDVIGMRSPGDLRRLAGYGGEHTTGPAAGWWKTPTG